MRKIKELTIPSDAENNRDAGKTYVVTEMPASQAEKWAIRTLGALLKAGFEIPEEGQGMEMLARAGFEALGRINFYDIEPILDEMMGCVKAKSSAGVVRPLVEEDIEEVQTRFLLKKEVFELHTGFFDFGSLSKPSSTSSATRTS